MERSYGLALTLVGAVFKYTAPTIRRLHSIVNAQLETAVQGQGQGIRAARYGPTSFQVSAGSGLQVLVAPGAGTILGTTLPSANIERPTQFSVFDPPIPANQASPIYIWQGLENNPPDNRTEETRRPKTFWSTNASEPNAICLASIASTGTNSIGTITDLRGRPIDRTGLIATDDIGIGQIAKEQLDYAVATDITLNLTANTWTTFIAAQNFTIDRADARQPYVSPFGNVGFYPTSGSGRVAVRARIDNATNIPMSGNAFNGNPVNVLAGCGITPLDGLAAGVHTIEIQIMAEQAGTVYCRASSATMLENYRMRVVEGKR